MEVCKYCRFSVTYELHQIFFLSAPVWSWLAIPPILRYRPDSMSAPPDAPERSPTRPSLHTCSRRESARLGASFQISESAVADAQSELATVKRRLRKYAYALDAVSKSAKEEIQTALEARNGALAEASTITVERDNLAKNCDNLASRLKSHVEETVELKRRFDVNNKCLTKAVSEVSRLRNELERSKRFSSDLRTKVNTFVHQKSNLSANLTSERLSKRGIMEERDALQEDLNASNAELCAVKRELALVRHELATRSPPEISEEVRDDIAHRSARAVERRTLKVIRAVAKHFLEFKVEQQKEVQSRELLQVKSEDSVSSEEENDYVSRDFLHTENVTREFASIANGGGEQVSNEDIADEIGDIVDADEFLEKYMAAIKQATAEADSMCPSSVFFDSVLVSSSDGNDDDNDDDWDETEEDEFEISDEEVPGDVVEDEPSVFGAPGNEVEEIVATAKKVSPVDESVEPTSVIVQESGEKLE